MKRFSKVVILAASAALVLSGCAGSGEVETVKVATDDINGFYKITPVSYTAADYVDIGDYSSFEVTLDEDDYTISDEDVQEYVEDQIDGYTYSVITDKEVAEDGDSINCDVYFTIDGVDTSNYDMLDGTLTIGENFMQVDGFDEQITDVPVGESREFTLTFPDDYPIAAFAGKEADFTVNIYYVVELYPMTFDELTDSWVSTVFGYDTVEEYLQDIKDNLQVDADAIRTNAIQVQVINDLIARSDIKGFPEGLKDVRIAEYKNYYIYLANKAGLTLDEYLENYDLDEETWDAQLDSYMGDMIQMELVYMVIAQKEGADTETVNYNSYVAGMRASEDVDSDYFDTVFPEDYCRLLYCEQVALDILVANANISD